MSALASPKADPVKVARRTKCGIPEEVVHVEKRQPALDMTDETRSWGIEVPLVVAREMKQVLGLRGLRKQVRELELLAVRQALAGMAASYGWP